jgi:endogenous inhibitor of DNA gyrase (YacG/DUF329 family)
MSDIAKCPACQKYIDVTLKIDNCPKCQADLSNIDIKPASSNKYYVSPEEMEHISSYIGLSVVSLVFCGLGGIIALTLSLLTISAKKNGDYSAALSYSSYAKGVSIVSIIIGILAVLGKLADKN